MSIRFSLASAWSAIDFESGDQKAPLPSSVPGSSRDVKEFISRSQRLGVVASPFFCAVKTKKRPSGEMAELK